jgi:LacI family transcriptional regulator
MAANLSPTSVSLVLNGKANQISSRSRACILAAAERLGYRSPAKFERPNVSGPLRVSVILPDIGNSFFTSIAGGIDAYLAPLGGRMDLMFSDNSPTREMECLDGIARGRTDGLIIATTLRIASGFYEKAFEKAGVPVVLADRVFPTLNYSTVSYNHKKGAFLATEYLIRLGHRRIACLIGNSREEANADPRYLGYRWAFEEAGLTPPPDALFPGDYRLESGYRAADGIVGGGFTALFSCNDMMAYGFFKRARELGREIPRDISVVGYDDLFFSNLIDPPLTSVSQNPVDIGLEAARRLACEIQEPGAVRQTVYFEPKLIPRGSARPISF